MAIKDYNAVAASIAHALNAARIPCVLWGHLLLIVHGVPTILDSIDFVVPDDLLDAAIRVLANLAFAKAALLTPCPNAADCSKTRPGRMTPPPLRHFHLEGSCVSVGLYVQRDTLWFLPPLKSMSDGLLAPAKRQLPPYFWLASDQTALPPWRPGRSDGRFKPGYSPVVVVKAHVLLEAYMRIHARDVGTMIGLYSAAMIAYMTMYVEEDGYLDADQLPDVFKESYREQRDGTKTMRQWTRELRKALGMSPEWECKIG